MRYFVVILLLISPVFAGESVYAWQNSSVQSRPAQPQVTVTQQSSPPLPLRGPLRVKLGTALGQAMADITMSMFMDAIPRAIGDSLARGQYQLHFQSTEGSSQQKPEVLPAPPTPNPPLRSPQRRGIFPRR